MTHDDTQTPLQLYLSQLTDKAAAHQLLDIRWAQSGRGMRQRFIRAQESERAARLIAALSSRADVFVGVALRERRFGGRAAIAGSRLVFTDCDRAGAASALTVHLPPTIETDSGTPGHRHLYWRLEALARVESVHRANRRLALALDGDLRSADVARVLRPPQTVNHKSQPPHPVRLRALRVDARYRLSDLLARLPPDPVTSGKDSRGARSAQRTELDRQLLAIPAAQYVQALTGRSPNSEGKVLCPLHAERHPSLQLYADNTFYCFGCQRGGSVIDFSAALWDCSARGADFLALRARLAHEVGVLRSDEH